MEIDEWGVEEESKMEVEELAPMTEKDAKFVEWLKANERSGFLEMETDLQFTQPFLCL